MPCHNCSSFVHIFQFVLANVDCLVLWLQCHLSLLHWPGCWLLPFRVIAKWFSACTVCLYCRSVCKQSVTCSLFVRNLLNLARSCWSWRETLLWVGSIVSAVIRHWLAAMVFAEFGDWIDTGRYTCRCAYTCQSVRNVVDRFAAAWAWWSPAWWQQLRPSIGLPNVLSFEFWALRKRCVSVCSSLCWSSCAVPHLVVVTVICCPIFICSRSQLSVCMIVSVCACQYPSLSLSAVAYLLQWSCCCHAVCWFVAACDLL